MQQHVVNLELSKRLKEAGYPQESSTYFRWLDFHGEFRTLLSESFVREDDKKEWYAAPLATELLERLSKNMFLLSTLEKNGKFCYMISIVKNDQQSWCFPSLPDALAEMWLWLKENNFLDEPNYKDYV